MTKGKLWKAKEQLDAATDIYTKSRIKAFILVEIDKLEKLGTCCADLTEAVQAVSLTHKVKKSNAKTVTITLHEYNNLLALKETRIPQLKAEIGLLKGHLHNIKVILAKGTDDKVRRLRGKCKAEFNYNLPAMQQALASGTEKVTEEVFNEMLGE